MNKFIEVMSTKDTYTANGAVTNSTSLSSCLDLFFLAGACRNERPENIEAKLTAAYIEDKIKTLKIIFWAGDIRQGAGERRFFKLALNWLNKNHQEDLHNYLKYVPEYSRWDVLFELATENEKVLEFIYETLACINCELRSSTHGLLCKWLPRKKQYNNLALKLQKRLGFTPRQYRKLLVDGTKVVEQQMCAKEWLNINYAHVPSVAINKYRQAWYRNDQERFEKYLEDVKSGKSKINASVIFPHDIVKSSVGWQRQPLTESQIVQWNNLPNYLEGKTNSIIPVCDVSGSMECGGGLPMAISVALGLYISERNEGVFKDAFITFSQRPKMQYLKGDVNERIQQLSRAEWGYNTDLIAVFDLILDKAQQNNLKQSDLPETILVISDMEFDEANYNRGTNFEVVKRAYSYSGYTIPKIVFWNVNGRAGNLPVTMRDENVALISGASPSIIKAVLSNDIDPIKVMNNIIETERYSFIKE